MRPLLDSPLARQQIWTDQDPGVCLHFPMFIPSGQTVMHHTS